jgi:hypothetical protein
VVPIDVLTGRQSATEYIAGKIPAAAALAAASELLPPDTPVGYFGLQREGAQLYTEARLTYFGADPEVPMGPGILMDFDRLGTTPEAVLASLDRLGINYFIWHRPGSQLQDWRSTLLSTDFLRANTRILEGDDGGYLFEVLPNTDEPWGAGRDNLLTDPGLETVGTDDPWTVGGEIRARKGLVSLRPKSSLAQRVPVVAGNPYLLLASGRCGTASDRAMLTLRWFDVREVELATDTERVIPGAAGSAQFLWHRAPERAAAVSAEVSTPGSTRCEFDEISLYDQG